MKKPLFQLGSALSALLGLILLFQSPQLGMDSVNVMVHGSMDTGKYMALLQDYMLVYLLVGLILFVMGLAGVLVSLYLFGVETADALKHNLWNKPSWYFSFVIILGIILWIVLSLFFPGHMAQTGMIVAALYAFSEGVVDWIRRKKFSYMYLVAIAILILTVFI